MFPSDASAHAAMVEELRQAGLKAEGELRDLRARHKALEAENARLTQQLAPPGPVPPARDEPPTDRDACSAVPRDEPPSDQDASSAATQDGPPTDQAPATKGGAKAPTGPADVGSTSRSSRASREGTESGKRETGGAAATTEVQRTSSTRAGPTRLTRSSSAAPGVASRTRSSVEERRAPSPRTRSSAEDRRAPSPRTRSSAKDNRAPTSRASAPRSGTSRERQHSAKPALGGAGGSKSGTSRSGRLA